MPAGKLMGAALLLSVCVRVLSGLEVKCTVSRDGGATTYELQEEFGDEDGKKWQFSWFNETRHVLANHQGQMALVMRSSFKALTTARCIEHILCEGHATSEGRPVDYSANCTTTCPAEPEPGDKGTLRYSIAAAVIVFLLLAGIVCLCRRKRSCGRGCSYTSAVNGNQRAGDVETGNDPAA